MLFRLDILTASSKRHDVGSMTIHSENTCSHINYKNLLPHLDDQKDNAYTSVAAWRKKYKAMFIFGHRSQAVLDVNIIKDAQGAL